MPSAKNNTPFLTSPRYARPKPDKKKEMTIAIIILVSAIFSPIKFFKDMKINKKFIYLNPINNL